MKSPCQAADTLRRPLRTEKVLGAAVVVGTMVVVVVVGFVVDVVGFVVVVGVVDF